MPINFPHLRDCLKEFDFQKLFVRELGWSQPAGNADVAFEIKGESLTRRQVAQLAGVAVLEITAADGRIPDAKTRAAVHREVAKLHHENVLIFLDRQRTQSLWYWVKRHDGKSFPRDHLYVKGQPGDLFVSKLGQIVFDLGDFDVEGNVSLVEVARRLRDALDVERVTKRFYGEFQEQHLAFLELIQGVRDERDRRWYASVLLNRLMFIYFLQQKGFLDGGDLKYLQGKLDDSRRQGRNRFFSGFLKLLFFEGFAKPEPNRTAEARAALGQIKYLNGGLFLPHHVEQQYPKLDVPDKAFENLFALFERYSWNLNDTPGGKDDEINPDVLGYIFEKYINQKAFGAYYTRPEITEYLCERTIHRLVLDAVNTPEAVLKHPPAGVTPRRYETIAELLMDLDATLCKRLLREVLPKLSLLDPACGSGAFLVAAMKTLIGVYAAVIGKIKFLADRDLSAWLAKTEKAHPSLNYFIKKSIITDNLYGVDVMEEATEIARLRLFLALVAAAETVDDLEPLPNIDFNILPGNSLVGLMRVDDADFERRGKQGNLFRKNYRQVLAEKNKLIDDYRHHAAYTEDLAALRDQIEGKKREALDTLDDILLDEFNGLGIKFEQATWDLKTNKAGKPVKRALKPADIEALRPFHWGFEFDEILHSRGGFDAIITNPPWEIFKPNAKEFFEDYSDLVSKKNMTIHDFEKEQAKLLKDEDLRAAWCEYLSGFPHVSAFFRSTPQFKNQISIVNGKKAGTDINLHKLFVERCFNLLRADGYCGIVIPSGIYTDLGAKQLREMLFSGARVSALFGFENRRTIFEGVDSRFKFVVLTFEKGGTTRSFAAAFMRHDVAELDRFPDEGGIQLSVDVIRRLSPDSLSVMEFKSDTDVGIAEKMLRFPLLGEEIEGKWGARFNREFDMTNDAGLFKNSPGDGLLPLFEGKMIWHFDRHLAEPRYWVNEKEGRRALLRGEKDQGQELDYQRYRLGFRDVAASTNERSAIAAILPAGVFAGNTVPVHVPSAETAPSAPEILFLAAAFDSFVFDWLIRTKITNHLNFFYVYQMPVPRLTDSDAVFAPIVERAARLTCTSPEFDALAKEVGLKSHRNTATDAMARGRLRAELDGLVAHLYGLTEDEFAHILKTFPLVPEPVKVAAHNAYRDVDRGLIQ
ncbi:MAG TPA: DNA methyltransferase [Pirellulales bacterium]|nr:DNA methyltransferase [Pirellulales bacterium]